MALLFVYLISIPLAMILIMQCRVENRKEYKEGGDDWWPSFKYAIKWGDVAAGFGVGIIPVLGTVAAAIMVIAVLAMFLSETLSKPVFKRKVVINLNKEQQ